MEHEALHEMARQIAPLLGEGWEYIRGGGGWLARIAGPNGALIVLAGWDAYSPKSKQGRYAIWGEYPPRTNCSRVEITVKASKTPEQVAGEIARRFMPEYLRLYAKAAVRLQDEKEAAREVILAPLRRVAEAVGATVEDGHGRAPHVRVPDLRVLIWGRNTEQVLLGDMAVTPEQAIAIITLLRGEG